MPYKRMWFTLLICLVIILPAFDAGCTNEDIVANYNTVGISYATSIAMTNDTLAVGAPNESGVAGKVFLYIIDSTSGNPLWTDSMTVTAPSYPDSHLFGRDLAFGKDILVVSCADDIGETYVYTKVAPGNYVHYQTIEGIHSHYVAADLNSANFAMLSPDDQSFHICYSNTVGSWNCDANPGGSLNFANEPARICMIDSDTIFISIQRTVHEYELQGTIIVDQGELSTNEGGTAEFGGGLRCANDVVVVGSPNENGVLGIKTGKLYFYVNKVFETEVDFAETNDHVGSGLAISGDGQLVAAAGYTYFYVFARNGDTFSQIWKRKDGVHPSFTGVGILPIALAVNEFKMALGSATDETVWAWNPVCNSDAVDECSSSPCTNGVCNSANYTYTFSCDCSTTGWTGSLCDVDIDDCGSAPCSSGSLCADTGQNSFSCTDIDDCASSPCVGFETCTDGGADLYICEDVCVSDPCQNGGSCTASSLFSYDCSCVSGFTSSQCDVDIDDCASSPCLNGATCSDAGANLYSCDCASGFTGDNCDIDIDDCASSPCVNGACTDDGTDIYSCACDSGYTGDNCQTDIDDCASNPCANGGVCADALDLFSCDCSGTGHSGSTCSNPFTSCAINEPCLNGTCSDVTVSDEASYECTCFLGYEGTECEVNIDDCASNPCANGGVCNDKVTNYTCACSSGWEGSSCNRDIDDCVSNPCQNGGACIDAGVDKFACVCISTGATGELCESDLDECNSNPCGGFGTCTDAGLNAFSCDCIVGRTGTECSLDIDDCESNPCQNGGTCADEGLNAYSCDCTDTGASGTECQSDVDDCASSPCDNGGTCSDNGLNAYLCDCNATGADGDSCEFDIDDCTSGPCQNGGSCTDNGLNAYVCDCTDTGATDTLCETDIDDCNSSPCLNQGTCTDTGLNSFSCDCTDLPYDGETCSDDINECLSGPCMNGGVCSDAGEFAFLCDCTGTGWKGETCTLDVDDCASTPCANNGSCVDTGNKAFLCDCADVLYYGTFCNENAAPSLTNLATPINRTVYVSNSDGTVRTEQVFAHHFTVEEGDPIEIDMRSYFFNDDDFFLVGKGSSMIRISSQFQFGSIATCDFGIEDADGIFQATFEASANVYGTDCADIFTYTPSNTGLDEIVVEIWDSVSVDKPINFTLAIYIEPVNAPVQITSLQNSIDLQALAVATGADLQSFTVNFTLVDQDSPTLFVLMVHSLGDSGYVLQSGTVEVVASIDGTTTFEAIAIVDIPQDLPPGFSLADTNTLDFYVFDNAVVYDYFIEYHTNDANNPENATVAFTEFTAACSASTDLTDYEKQSCNAQKVSVTIDIECETDSYVNVWSNERDMCRDCPTGGYCDQTGASAPVNAAGYAQSENTDFVFIECVPVEACPAAGEGCAAGYGGSLCGDCVGGYYRSKSLCKVCPDTQWITFVLYGAAVFVLLLLILWLATQGRFLFKVTGVVTMFFQTIWEFSFIDLKWTDPMLKVFDALSIFSFDIDLLSVECQLDPSTPSHQQYAIKFLSFMFLPFALTVLLLLLVAFAYLFNVCQFQCAKRGCFLEQSCRSCHNCYVTTCYECYCPPERAVKGQRLRRNYEQRITGMLTSEVVEPESYRSEHVEHVAIRAFTMLCAFLFLPLTSKAMSFFDCTKQIDGVYTLDAQPGLTCLSNWWWNLFPFALGFLLLYVVAIPTYFIISLRKRPAMRSDVRQYIIAQESSWLRDLWLAKWFIRSPVVTFGDDEVPEYLHAMDSWEARYNSLTLPYNPAYYYWEMIFMSRKLAVTFVKIFFTKYPVFQATIILMLMSVYLGIQYIYRPFVSNAINSLERHSIVSAICIIFLGILLHSEDNLNTVVREVVGTLAVTVIGIALVYIVYEIVQFGRQEKKAEAKKKAHDIDVKVKTRSLPKPRLALFVKTLMHDRMRAFSLALNHPQSRKLLRNSSTMTSFASYAKKFGADIHADADDDDAKASMARAQSEGDRVEQELERMASVQLDHKRSKSLLRAHSSDRKVSSPLAGLPEVSPDLELEAFANITVHEDVDSVKWATSPIVSRNPSPVLTMQSVAPAAPTITRDEV